MVEAVKPRKLAIGTMVRFAYRSVFGRLELIPELGWIMLLALLAVSILPEILLPGRHVGGELRLAPQDYVQAAVALLALSAFAVRWHQSILLGDPRRRLRTGYSGALKTETNRRGIALPSWPGLTRPSQAAR